MQDDMDKRGFYSMEKNTITIIDAMVSQTQQIMEEIVRKTEDLVQPKMSPMLSFSDMY